MEAHCPRLPNSTDRTHTQARGTQMIGEYLGYHTLAFEGPFLGEGLRPPSLGVAVFGVSRATQD